MPHFFRDESMSRYFKDQPKPLLLLDFRIGEKSFRQSIFSHLNKADFCSTYLFAFCSDLRRRPFTSSRITNNFGNGERVINNAFEITSSLMSARGRNQKKWGKGARAHHW